MHYGMLLVFLAPLFFKSLNNLRRELTNDNAQPVVIMSVYIVCTRKPTISVKRNDRMFNSALCFWRLKLN